MLAQNEDRESSYKESFNKELNMQNNTYDIAVFIGRFQPIHNSHIKVFEYAADIAEHILAIVGSSFSPRTIKNPFQFSEIEKMIRSSVPFNNRLEIQPVRDYLYSDTKWLADVKSIIDSSVASIAAEKGKNPKEIRVTIIGHKKDRSSYYLDLFPEYHNEFVPNFGRINGTKIREQFYLGNIDKVHDIPQSVRDFMIFFQTEYHREIYADLIDEYHYIVSYKNAWSDTPYPVTFVTADIVFYCSGHVLMVKRKMNPGKGLLALPGGFIAQNEPIIESAARELKEETKIEYNRYQIKEMISQSHVFDAPERSLRGRTVTHAFFIQKERKTLPEVKGGDDAEHAMWIPVQQLKMLEEEIFEDHLHIIDYFLHVL